MEGAETANLVEVFASAQGEGPFVGTETIFVRFGECDLRCGWCDSPGTWLPARECRIETLPGSGEFETMANPVPMDRLEAALGVLSPAGAGFVSLTGGEPLLQPGAVIAAARSARRLELQVYLETHGLSMDALRSVLAEAPIDVVSMDWKLASDVARAEKVAGEASFHERHAEFLEVACAAEDTEVYCKIVLTPNTLDEELEDACRTIASVAPETLLVLQPVTPFARIKERPSATQILAWQRQCAAFLDEVRVIPQTHRMYEAP